MGHHHLRSEDYFGDFANDIMVVGDRLGVVMVARNGRAETYYPIMETYDSESRLSGGRFWNFDNRIRSNSISVDMTARDGDTMKLIAHSAGTIIEWIAENCEEKWAFHIGKTGGRTSFTVFFHSINDAVLFRLSLVGKVNARI